MTQSHNGFAIIQRGGEKIFSLKGPWKREYLAPIIEQDIRALAMSAYAGYRESSLRFLAEVPFLDRLELMIPKLSDVDSIYELRGLKHLSIESNKNRINFERFHELESLALGSWSTRNYSSAFMCRSLRKVVFTSLPDEFLPSLSNLPSLENLSLFSCRFTDLSSLPSLPRLTRLSLIMCNLLADTRGIQSAPSLLVLWIEKAKRLSGLDGVRMLKNLRTLILRDCPKLISLQPIAGLSRLETIGLMQTTNIADGDLSVLKNLPRLETVRFVERKHYSHHLADFPNGGEPFY